VEPLMYTSWWMRTILSTTACATPVSVDCTRNWKPQKEAYYRRTVDTVDLFLSHLSSLCPPRQGTNKPRGLSPQENYTERATAACWRS
jgi:hypothetical protein